MNRLILLGEKKGLYINDELLLSKRKPKLWALFRLFFDDTSRKWREEDLIEEIWPNIDPIEKQEALRKDISNLNKLLKFIGIRIYSRNKLYEVGGEPNLEDDISNFSRAVNEAKRQKRPESIRKALDIVSDVSELQYFRKQRKIFSDNLQKLASLTIELYKTDKSLELKELLEKIKELSTFLGLSDTINKVRFALGEKVPLMEKYFCIASIDALNTKCIIVEANIREGWKVKDCKFKFIRDPKLEIEPDVKKIVEQHIDIIWQKRLSQKKALTNKGSYGLYDYVFRENSYKLEFVFKPTSYKEFVGTNQSLDVKLHKKIKQKYATLREYIKDLYKDDCPYSQSFLRSSFLSNRLGTATTVITSDNYLILTRGGEAKQVMPRKYMSSIAEGMVRSWRKGSTREHDRSNPFNTILRGAKQELLLTPKELDVKDIKILAFGFFCEYIQPFIWAYAEARCSADTIIRRRRDRLEPKFYDVDKVFAVEFTPEGVAKLIVDLERWSPPQALGVYLALCHKFPKEEVDRYIEKAYKGKS